MRRYSRRFLVTTLLASTLLATMFVFPLPQNEPIRATIGGATVLYFASYWEGVIYSYNVSSGQLDSIFQGVYKSIGSFSLSGKEAEKIYIIFGNDRSIFLYSSGSLQEIYKHETWVRWVRILRSDQGIEEIFFSEAYGAGKDGKIYRLVNGNAELYMEVPLEKVGFWAGGFDIAPDGTTYLTSGNRVPSTIFEVKGGVYTELASFPFPLMAPRYVEDVSLNIEGSRIIVNRGLLISGHNKIYLFDLHTRKIYIIYENQGIERIDDAALELGEAITAPSRPVSASLTKGATLYILTFIEKTIYSINISENELKPVFAPDIPVTSFDVAGKSGEKIYFVFANDPTIYMYSRGNVTQIYRHRTYVRFVRETGGKLFFSESQSLCSGMVYIWMLDDRGLSEYARIPISELGCWLGGFDVAPDGTVYIVVFEIKGNKPAPPYSIYELKNGVYRKVAEYDSMFIAPRYVEDINLVIGESNLRVEKGLLLAGYLDAHVYLYDLSSRHLYLVYSPTRPAVIIDTDINVPVPIYLVPKSNLIVGVPRYETEEGIFVSKVTSINITASNLAREIKYRIDNGEWRTYSGPFNLAGLSEGKHRISYYSVGSTGQKEKVKTVELILDSTPPQVVNFTPTGILEVDASPINVTFTFTIKDKGSGVMIVAVYLDQSSQSYRVSGNTYYVQSSLSEGNHTILINTLDRVGNGATYRYTLNIVVKKALPSLEIILLIAATLIAVLMLILRRRKAKPTSTPPPNL